MDADVMHRGVMWGAALVAAVAGGALFHFARSADDPVKPVRSAQKELTALYRRASSAARFRRVLVIHFEPGKPATGRILESGRSSGGWALFPPSPPGSTRFDAMLVRLADTAAKDWAVRREFAPDTLSALWYFDVALVAVENGREAVDPDVDDDHRDFRKRSGVPGFEIRAATPVWHVVGEPELDDPDDAILYARGLRKGTAHLEGLDDGLWDLDVTVHADGASDYLFAAPAEGARVTVNDAPAAPLASTGPFLKLRLPAGPSRVRIRYGDTSGRDWAAVLAVAAVMLGLFVFVRGFRTEPTEG